MTIRRKRILSALLVVGLAMLACNAFLPQSAPAATAEPAGLPRTEDEVPRVTVEEAKAAMDAGQAVIVDVRNASSYGAGHIPGAVHIPLEQIEADPSSVELSPEEWIITYCT